MSAKNTSRRNFLKMAGVSLGASAVLCVGGGYTAAQTPEIATPKFTFGKGGSMNQPVLIAYATRAGSTAEVAAAIGETLSKRGYSVEVQPIKNNPNPQGYQAVLIGSAVRMGAWLPEAVAFVKTNQALLNQVPTALFTVHLMNLGDDEASLTNRKAYLNEVRPLIQPLDEAFFAGVGDFTKVSLLERVIARAVKSPQGDLRDWDRIRDWAQTTLA